MMPRKKCFQTEGVTKELSESLTELGASPLKLHGIRADSRVAQGKRKM